MAISDTTSSFLFVYGTLLTPGNEFGLYLADNCRFVKKGKFKGRLYNMGEYPGAVPDAGGSYVQGKIFKLKNSLEVLKLLDEYEGISPTDPLPHEYVRIIFPVETDEGPLPCWVYLYNWPVDGYKLIESGDWATQSPS